MIQIDDLLLDVAQKFETTPYRRLPILDDNGCLLGQVSRRDVLRAEHRMALEIMARHSDERISERCGRSPISFMLNIGPIPMR